MANAPDLQPADKDMILDYFSILLTDETKEPIVVRKA